MCIHARLSALLEMKGNPIMTFKFSESFGVPLSIVDEKTAVLVWFAPIRTYQNRTCNKNLMAPNLNKFIVNLVCREKSCLDMYLLRFLFSFPCACKWRIFRPNYESDLRTRIDYGQQHFQSNVHPKKFYSTLLAIVSVPVN